MAKDTTRRSIIREGARLVHSKGYNNTGLSDILQAAGVPKGSFYFYFKNKDDFGLALVDYYWEFIRSMGETYLSDSSIPPLKRLAGFMDAYQELFEKMGLCYGCPIGNLMQEMSDLSEDFRDKVGNVYSRMQDNITNMLREAQELGDLPPDVDPDRTAQFILNSWEGAIMQMKLVKSSEPLKVFKQMVFDRILKPL
jgi:TetR/AcrR family transcriptional regulator, transcriptional repressor for nem operon